MQIELNEQLNASFPSDSIALKNMILQDVGVNDLGVNVTEMDRKIFLNYPVHIFSMIKE